MCVIDRPSARGAACRGRVCVRKIFPPRFWTATFRGTLYRATIRRFCASVTVGRTFQRSHILSIFMVTVSCSLSCRDTSRLRQTTSSTEGLGVLGNAPSFQLPPPPPIVLPAHEGFGNGGPRLNDVGALSNIIGGVVAIPTGLFRT